MSAPYWVPRSNTRSTLFAGPTAAEQVWEQRHGHPELRGNELKVEAIVQRSDLFDAWGMGGIDQQEGERPRVPYSNIVPAATALMLDQLVEQTQR